MSPQGVFGVTSSPKMMYYTQNYYVATTSIICSTKREFVIKNISIEGIKRNKETLR